MKNESKQSSSGEKKKSNNIKRNCSKYKSKIMRRESK